MKVPALHDQAFSASLNASMRFVYNAFNDVARSYLSDQYNLPVLLGEPIDIEHGLGKVPDGFTIALSAAPMNLYATAADRMKWSSTNIRDRSDMAGAAFRLVVFHV